MFVVHKNIKLAPDSSVILVDNTLDALGNTARFYRQSLPAKVTAITGSNGKTTTKDILGAILSSNYKIAITEGTKNNLVGLPQTIFCADKSCRFLIVELGINHFGEMDRLASIAIPDIAIITNIGPSHLEFLHNEEGVCKAKSEIFNHMAEKSAVILNKDDRFFSTLSSNANCNVVTFGIKNNADYRAENISATDDGSNFDLYIKSENTGRIAIPLFGKHNILNFLSATAAALEFGISLDTVKNAVSTIKPSKMRMEIMKFKGFTVINDTYNANPRSAVCALEELDKIQTDGKKILVFADMLELGDKSEFYHREIGRFINNSSINSIITIGNMAKFTAMELKNKNVKSADSIEEGFKFLTQTLSQNDVVLLKGSRANQLEKIIEMLK